MLTIASGWGLLRVLDPIVLEFQDPDKHLARFALIYVQFTSIWSRMTKYMSKKFRGVIFSDKNPAGRYTTSHRACNLHKSFNLCNWYYNWSSNMDTHMSDFKTVEVVIWTHICPTSKWWYGHNTCPSSISLGSGGDVEVSIAVTDPRRNQGT